MLTHGRGLICLALTERAVRQAPPAPADRPEHRAARHRVHRHRRRAPALRRHHRRQRARPRDDGAGRHRRRRAAAGPAPPRPHQPAARPRRRRARARGADRRLRRPGAPRRHEARRRHLRGHARGRRDDAPPGARGVLRAHGLKMCTIADLISYRLKREQFVKRIETRQAADALGHVQAARLPERRSTRSRTWRCARAASATSTRTATVIVHDEPVLVRVHSECLTGDVFGSGKCDCGGQLDAAMQMIDDAGKGVLRLPPPGRPRHRPGQQAARLRASGEGPRHRRGEPAARPAGRQARLRHRQPDPPRPGAARTSAS